MNFDEVTQIPPKKETDTVSWTEKKIREFAEEELEKWELNDWSFKFNSRIKKAVGKCKRSTKSIMLSETWFVDVGVERLVREGVREDIVEDVIRHEIAHALDFEERGRSDHSWRWKRKAEKVGADPTRTCDIPNEIRKLVASWYRECPNCGRKSYYYKKPHSKRDHGCVDCCKEYNNGEYDDRFKLEVKENDPVI